MLDSQHLLVVPGGYSARDVAVYHAVAYENLRRSKVQNR